MSAWCGHFLLSLLTDTNTILSDEAIDVIFNDFDSKKVDISKGVDNVLLSAVNFYGPDVTSKDVYDFYSKVKSPDPLKPLSHGLHSKLVKENGIIIEQVYKSGGLYGSAIDEIIKWLELALDVAENKPQGDALSLLISFPILMICSFNCWDCSYGFLWYSSKASVGICPFRCKSSIW